MGEEKGFDPLGVTDALPVYWVREAELKHGRICMLATVGEGASMGEPAEGPVTYDRTESKNCQDGILDNDT